MSQDTSAIEPAAEPVTKKMALDTDEILENVVKTETTDTGSSAEPKVTANDVQEDNTVDKASEIPTNNQNRETSQNDIDSLFA